MPETTISLIFTNWSDDTGVFFKEDTFYKIWDIDEAIEKAKTWGELRELLPTEVFESFPIWHINGGGRIYWGGENYLCVDQSGLDEFLQEIEGEDESRYVVKHSDELEIWGMEDFEYPMWVLARTWNEFPKEFMDRFASDEAHPASGSWIEYPMDEFDEMENSLSKNGFAVRRIEYSV